MTPARPALKDLRVDQVGSLLRPQALKDAFLAHARGAIDEAALAAVQDEAIRAVVRAQEELGLPIVTDGEYRRLNWQVSFCEVEGWDLGSGARAHFVAHPDNRNPGEQPLTRGEDAVVAFRVPATARLRLVRNFPLEELRLLRAIARRPVKVTLIGPDRILQMCDLERSAPFYRDADEFLADVVAIERRIVSELVAAGCDYVQLDEPSYTGYVDPPTLARMRARGDDPMRRLARAIEADNAVIRDLRGRATFGLHICRGNRASMWHREGAYDAIAEPLLGGLQFDRLLLEYDSPRAGGFEPLRFVPRGGPTVVLGLVTTKVGTLEAKDELKRRIDEASRHVPLAQLALSPQCGFASGIGGNLLSEVEQWAKLGRVLEVAREIWGELALPA